MTKNALLPDRHPTSNFFIADIFDALPVKADRHTLEHPFFTLSTKKDVRTVRYEKDNISIVLSPSSEYGLPTMMDKDILLYCGSLVVGALNEEKNPPKTLRFSAHDLMVTTNRHTNDVAYRLLKNSFERLRGVSITTNIKTNNRTISRGFGLIDSWEVLENSRDKRRMVRVEVTLSDWFYNSLIAREVLTINRDYFRLRKTLERRIYELARKHCGKQKKWSIILENLHQKSGSLSPLKNFRFQLRKIIEDDIKYNHFPDYYINLSNKDVVIFHLKKDQSLYHLKQSDYLKGTTIETAKRIVHDAGTGWDFNAMIAEFAHHIKNKENPNNINGALIGFIKKKVVKAP